jgi:hypothetical protein
VIHGCEQGEILPSTDDQNKNKDLQDDEQVASKEEFGKAIDHCITNINSMDEVRTKNKEYACQRKEYTCERIKSVHTKE